MRKSWWAGRLHGATAGIWSIWRRFPACSRIWCRLVRIRCRSAARDARPLWRSWRIILGVWDSDDIAGYSPPVHRFGGSAGGADVCAHPALAIAQCHRAMNGMSKKLRKNVNRAMNLLNDYQQDKYDKVQRKEDLIDKYESRLGEYLIELTKREMIWHRLHRFLCICIRSMTLSASEIMLLIL